MKHKRLPKLDLNVTNDCNLRCRHCAFDSGQSIMHDMDVDKIREMLADTRALGGMKVDITGGEPTLRKDLIEIIGIAKEMGYRIELVTNGTLMSRTKLARLKEAGMESIAISLDGHDYQSHSTVRGLSKGQYRRALETIEESISLGIPTKINTIVCVENLQSIPRLTEFAIKSGACEHGIYYFTPVGRGSKGILHPVDPIRWLRFIRQDLSRYADKIRLSVEVPVMEKGLAKGFGCLLDEDAYHLQILPDGRVYPCAILASYGLPIASLNESKIDNVWNDERHWANYLLDIKKSVFSKHDGFCTDLNGYSIDRRRYSYVCPLRKFIVGREI
jgi:AdoMet-dependent heme synthase